MATDFKYASQSDLNRYVGDIVADADSKRQIYDWTSETYNSNTFYVAYNSGYMSQLFIDGKSQISGNETIGTTKIADAAEPMTDSEVTMDVSGFTNFIDESFIKVDDEIMFVTSIADADPDTVTIIRGVLGTTATTHDDGADIFQHFSGHYSEAGTNLYDQYNDFIILKYDSNPNDLVVEVGFDNKTYYDQMLVDASMELNNLLDARFPTPLPKYDQFDADTAHSSASTEYDAIIIKMTCYIAASNALRAIGETEKADYYYDLVTNAEKTGMADRLNLGEFKLAFEVDSHDDKGKVRNISKAGTMDIVETAGEWYGEKYDVVRITCTTGGAYGTAIVKAETYGNDALFGTTTENIKVTGGLQEIVNGLYVRFQGASMNLASTPDQWEVTVTGSDRKLTNAQTGAIDLTRRGYSV